MLKPLVSLLILLSLLSPTFSLSCESGISSWFPDQGDCNSADGSYRCRSCGFTAVKYSDGNCYCKTGPLDCGSDCESCGPYRNCYHRDQNPLPYLYVFLVFCGSVYSCIRFSNRMSKSYVNNIPTASLNFEPYKYYTPKNKLYVTWTPKREVHTTGSIYTTHNYYSYGSNSYAVPNVQGSISSEAIVIGYTIKITYDGPVDIGDRNIRLLDIPNYLTTQEVVGQVVAKTNVTRYGTCVQDSNYSTCLMECLGVCSVFSCCCMIYFPHYSEKRAQRKKLYENELELLANEKNNRHLTQLVEDADRLVTERVEAIKKKEDNNQKNNMNGGNGGNGGNGENGGNGNVNQNQNQNGQIVLTMDQLQLLLQNAQQGYVMNLPGMNDNQMPHAPPAGNNDSLI